MQPTKKRVWICTLDQQVVKPSDIYKGRHVRERDEHGRVKVLCGKVKLIEVETPPPS